jgi:protein-disulfide isomerase
MAGHRGRTVAVGVALLLAACTPSSELEEIKAQQAEILAKLDAIAQKLESGGAPRPVARAPSEDYNRAYTIQIGRSPIRGNPNAPVTLVAYSDFQCPFCARAIPHIDALQAKYPDKLRVVFKHFPLTQIHPSARPAAVASFAAQEQGRFWEFHDAVFRNQATLAQPNWEALAGEAGLDVGRFRNDLARNSAAYEKRVDEDLQQAEGLDVRATPTLYINGKKVPDYRNVDGMSAMVEAALNTEK